MRSPAPNHQLPVARRQARRLELQDRQEESQSAERKTKHLPPAQIDSARSLHQTAPQARTQMTWPSPMPVRTVRPKESWRGRRRTEATRRTQQPPLRPIRRGIPMANSDDAAARDNESGVPHAQPAREAHPRRGARHARCLNSGATSRTTSAAAAIRSASTGEPTGRRSVTRTGSGEITLMASGAGSAGHRP